MLMQVCKWECQRQLLLLEPLCPPKQQRVLNNAFVASAKGAPISGGYDHKLQMKKVKLNLIFFFLQGYTKTSTSPFQLHQELESLSFHSAGFISRSKRLVDRRAFVISPLAEKERVALQSLSILSRAPGNQSAPRGNSWLEKLAVFPPVLWTLQRL